MKIDTDEEISFTNCYSGLYLNKKEGAVAIDFRSSEIVIYLNTSLYQALAWLLHNASSCEQLMSVVNCSIDPAVTKKASLIEVHGPEHAVCLICAPEHERVQLNLEIGVSLDLKYADFKGLAEIIQEAQNDLEWRRQLLQWSFSNNTSENHNNEQDKKDKRAK